MDQLPETWTIAEIEHLLVPLDNGKCLQQGWSPQCDSEPARSDDWGVLKTTAIQDGVFLTEHNKRLPIHLQPRQNIEVRVKDILMTCAGPRSRCGVVCLVRHEVSHLMMSGKMYRFRADESLASPEYLELFLRSRDAQAAIDRMKTGINDSGLNLTHDRFKKLGVPLAPLAEQHRIVAKIEELFSELDQGVASLKTAREQLKVYRQSLLKNAFEGKLTAAWRNAHRDQLETAAALQQRIARERQARYQQQLADWQTAGQAGPKPKPPKPLPPLTTEDLAELPELPEGWVFVRAEEIADFITKGTTPSKELLFSGNGEIPFIKVYNLTMTGALDFSIDPTFVTKETHQGFLNRSKVYPGDVLMNIVGPPLGKVSIVPPTYPEWNINQAIAIFRTAAITPKLIAKYLAHETTVRSMMKKSKATAGQFNLTLEICRETLIPLCGKLEQQQIELLIDEKLSEADQLDQTLATALQQADALRQSILKKAFHGQLVKQAKNEESATALLERIRAGKSNGMNTPHNRRKSG